MSFVSHLLASASPEASQDISKVTVKDGILVVACIPFPR